jgi:hypothetical protein
MRPPEDFNKRWVDFAMTHGANPEDFDDTFCQFVWSCIKIHMPNVYPEDDEKYENFYTLWLDIQKCDNVCYDSIIIREGKHY